MVSLWGDPRDVPPPGHVKFRGQVQQLIGPGPTTVVVAPVQLSSRSLGVIREFRIDVANLLATSIIVVALQVNGAPEAAYRYQVFPFATPHLGVSLLEKSDREYVDLPTNALVNVAVTVTDAVQYLIGVDFAGWSYPEDLRTYAQAV